MKIIIGQTSAGYVTTATSGRKLSYIFIAKDGQTRDEPIRSDTRQPLMRLRSEALRNWIQLGLGKEVLFNPNNN